MLRASHQGGSGAKSKKKRIKENQCGCADILMFGRQAANQHASPYVGVIFFLRLFVSPVDM